MSPRQKQYQTEEEKKQAHREHQKRYRERLKNKLNQLFNGNHKPTESMDTRSNQPNINNLQTESNCCSTVSPLKSEETEPKRISGVCEYCGCMMSIREAESDSKCKFCRQFETKEQALYEKYIMKRVYGVRKPDRDLALKYERELRQDWKCPQCHRVNRYYIKVCVGCGKVREAD